MNKFVTPTYKENLSRFTQTYLGEHGINSVDKSKGTELRVRCPFCHGGDKHEFSFDVNIDRGVARCWRATCGWSGTANSLYSEIMGISRKEAFVILSGGEGDERVMADFEAFDRLWMDTVWKVVDDEPLEFWEKVPGAVPLMDADDDIIEQVREWIQNRGYDFFEFINIHNILVPPQFQKWEGYVLFEFQVNNSLTYQGYKFRKDLLGVDFRLEDEERKFRIPKTRAASHRIKESLYRYNELTSPKAVLLCEGIFDCARLLSYGFQATCSFSNTVSEVQAFLITQLNVKEVVVFYDYNTEKSSIKAAKLIAKYAKPKGIKVSYVTITKKDADPDELSKQEVLECLKRRTFIYTGVTDEQLLKQFEQLSDTM